MSAEKFCLRWNDFETNISVAFKELREEKDFFDVTLACDDNQVQAHKVILSACSPFFRTVLRRNPHQHPLLYLKGVKYQDLLAVLSFMYNGEVNVAQEELNTFLSVAEDLRVKGLTQNTSAGPPKKSPPPSQDAVRQNQRPREPPERDPPPPPTSLHPQQPKRPRTFTTVSNPVQSYHQQYDDDIAEVVPVKSEPRDPLPPPPQQGHEDGDHAGFAQHGQEMVVEQHVGVQEDVDHGAVALDQSYAEDNYGYEDYGDGYDSSVMMNAGGMGASNDANKDIWMRDRMLKNMDGLWQCNECGYSSNKTSNVRNHIEVNHTISQGYYCQECNKFCRSKNSLSIHKSRYKH